jgi:CheY-like chemotaxis protein
VREGLVVLLKAWGASVLDFDTVASLQAWLDAGAGQAGAGPPEASPTRSGDALGAARPWPLEAPDLLLVDYRLPQGHTGLDALAAVRARWPQRRLPAIVITGSTIGGHEDEAAEHDFHLLIKPVLPNKLRAMIAFKLGVR